MNATQRSPLIQKILGILVISVMAAQQAHAQAGPIGSQFQFESIFQLIFILGFMVVFFTIIAFVFGILGSAAAWIGGKAQASIDEMSSRQREKEAIERVTLDRLNRLFPRNKKPGVDWAEVQDEIVITRTSVALLWQDYHDNAKGSLTQSQFDGAHEAWLQDAKAQNASLERANRDWSEQRTTRVAEAYGRVFAALDKSGATEEWATHLRTLSATAETSREELIRELAADSMEDALASLSFASHPALWVELQTLLGKHLAMNARDKNSKCDDSEVLDRAAAAYRQACDKLNAKSSILKRDELEFMKLRLDYSHVLMRLGQTGDATAASSAERILEEVTSNFPPGANAHTIANTKLNLARAAETQGDCATGPTRRAHYIRARTLNQSALTFGEDNKVDKLPRAKKNLERLEEKLRQS